MLDAKDETWRIIYSLQLEFALQMRFIIVVEVVMLVLAIEVMEVVLMVFGEVV